MRVFLDAYASDLAAFVGLALFLGMIVVWAAIGAGA